MGRKKILFILGMLLASVVMFIGGLVMGTGYRNLNVLTDPDAVVMASRPLWESLLYKFDWKGFFNSLPNNFDWSEFFKSLPDDFDWGGFLDNLPDDFDWGGFFDDMPDDFDWGEFLRNVPDDFDWKGFYDNLPDNFDWGEFLQNTPPDFDWSGFLSNMPSDFDWGDFLEDLPPNFDWGNFLSNVPDNFDWGKFLSSTPPNFDWANFIKSMPPEFDWSKIPWQSFGEDFAWDQMPWQYLIPLAMLGAITMPWDKISPEDVPSELWEQFNYYPSEWFHVHEFDGDTNMCTVCHRPRLYIQGRSDVFVYNGLPQSSNSAEGEKFEIVAEKCGLLPQILGHTVEVTYDVSLTYVKNDNTAGGDGSYYNTFTVTVRDDAGQDVTNNYAIDRGFGTIKIAPRTITIETKSDSKAYDGDPLECAIWSYAEGSLQLVEGDTFNAYRFSEWPTEVGEYDNIIEAYTITNREGVDMSGNYEVIPIWGKLTITWD